MPEENEQSNPVEQSVPPVQPPQQEWASPPVQPQPQQEWASPPVQPQAQPQWSAPPPEQPYAPSSSGFESLIPTKNMPALIGYYCGVFSVVCGILAPVALVLGILGLNQIKKDPRLPGKAHAWVGIIVGGIFTLVWGFLFFFLLAASIAASQKT